VQVGADGQLRVSGSKKKNEPLKIFEDPVAPAAASTPDRKPSLTEAAVQVRLGTEMA
jgi:hypothetical protein